MTGLAFNYWNGSLVKTHREVDFLNEKVEKGAPKRKV